MFLKELLSPYPYSVFLLSGNFPCLFTDAFIHCSDAVEDLGICRPDMQISLREGDFNPCLSDHLINTDGYRALYGQPGICVSNPE